MPELSARDPTDGFELPLDAGGARLAARPLAGLVSIAPYRGRAAAVGERLGRPLPPPGGSCRGDDGLLFWAGLDLWFAETSDPARLIAALAPLAACTDQSDGWAGFALSGPAARDVLSRLVPLDLVPEAFPDGAAAVSLLRHIPATILRRGGEFELLVTRSYARSAYHDLETAMRAVAARERLSTL